MPFTAATSFFEMCACKVAKDESTKGKEKENEDVKEKEKARKNRRKKKVQQYVCMYPLVIGSFKQFRNVHKDAQEQR